MKKITIFMFSLLLILCSCIIFTITSRKVYADIASGTYDGVSWRITDDGELILGNGGTQTMYNRSYRQASYFPWSNRSALVKKVSVNGTIIAQGSIMEMFYCWQSSMSSPNYSYQNLISVDLRGLNTSHVTSMKGMFNYCIKLEEIKGIENFDTSNCTDIEAMFLECRSLKTLDLHKWDVSKVVYMKSAFNGCRKLSNLNTSGWNTNSATDMSFMFYNCQSLLHVDVSSWNTTNVTDMRSMFRNCYLINELSLSGFQTSKVTYFGYIFEYCKNLSSIDVSSFDTARATSLEGMFRHCDSLIELNLSNFNTKIVSSMKNMFCECGKLEKLDISSFSTQNVTDMNNIFLNDKKLKEINLSPNWQFKSNQAILPTPSEKQYTGKWIREDETYGPYTPAELKTNYIPEMSGIWVWELAEGNYTITYKAPDGFAGAMPTQTFNNKTTVHLAENAFYRFNYHFDHWDGSDGKIYTDKQTIPANTFQIGDTLTLTAFLVKNDNSVTAENGEFELTLHTNEQASFTDFPGGATYTIYEETPSGWQLINQVNPSGAIPANGSVNAQFTNEYVPGNTTVQLIATKTLDGNTPANNAYTFELLNADNEVIETKTNDASGMILFSPITITTAGDKIYYIKEVRGEDPGINYDSHIETITVHVTDDGAGNLTATPEYDADGAMFANYTKPGMLTVTKETDGNGTGDETFTFEIRLTDEYGRTLDNIDIITPAA